MDGNRLLCDTCRSRRNVTCGFCGRVSPSQVNWPRGPACGRCYKHVRNHPAPCPKCNRSLALIGQVDGVAVCGACSGYSTDYACTRCDNGAHTDVQPLCLGCAINDQLTMILAAVTSSAVAEQLHRVRAVLAHAERPGPAWNWLKRSLEHRLFHHAHGGRKLPGHPRDLG
jgi:RecJ-like exonuclease